MFSRCTWKYIIVYKLMVHKKALEGLDIDLFPNISIEINEKMVKDLKTHSLALDCDSFLLMLIRYRNMSNNLYFE